MVKIPQTHLLKWARQALLEDKAWQDITTQALPPRSSQGGAVILCQQIGILAGGNITKAVFLARDKALHVKNLIREGSPVRPGQKILSIRGSLRSILSAERTALNFLGHLSGVATLTQRFVTAVKGTGAAVYDTRKTTPGLRVLEKYAVRMGGGQNHRMDLADAVLLKDNHLKALRNSGDPVGRLQSLRKNLFKNKVIEMEAQNLNEIWEAIAVEADIILLDNLAPPILKKGLGLVRAAREIRGGKFPQAEVSGGVTLANIRAIAELGPDRISSGTLTHSATGINFNLDLL